MPDYDDSMRGVLFRNEKKDGPNHPDYKGNGEVNGIEVWISAWVKKAKTSGKAYMSLSFENKEGQQVATVESDIPVSTDDFLPAGPSLDDDIPF